MDVQPIVPDVDTAQSWVSTELARPEYNPYDNPLTSIVFNFLRRIVALFDGGHSDIPMAKILLVLFIAALIVLLIVTILNPIRVRQRASQTVFDEDSVSSAHSLESARQAAAHQQWNEALIWAYRALSMALHERGILVLTPGLTAQEVARSARGAYPQCDSAFTHAARAFDDVRYGEVQADETQYRMLISLVRSLSEEG